MELFCTSLKLVNWPKRLIYVGCICFFWKELYAL